ncbi:tRNA-nucleotidyltransferase [Anaeramoeba flamelloides]|uniref:tRNA-nucleotidyltransferase n=1 Tax=Anaeramoeba flamelloides TaxID=1746091 RepID=A0ABQ8X1A7_9EUKA|nr:tRNA-nucleotidyltransferase [Anaeramoeba flamelloides]
MTNQLLEITLTNQEKEIFKLMTSTITHHKLQTVVRVAGGWVRDKLLGLTSDDIDFTISDMTGEKFGNYVLKYLEFVGVDQFALPKLRINPQKSQQVGTARLLLSDLWLDLSQLRHEEYNDNSRIPKVTLGTPEQDAKRRDLTINSLFYNLNKQIVEDFTGKGIEDLKKKLSRTCYDSQQSFLDDPLRVFRTIRYTARFSLRPTEEIINALQNEKVHQMINIKISRERIGNELENMLTDPDPIHSLLLICQMQLYPLVFKMQEIGNKETNDVLGYLNKLLEMLPNINDWNGWKKNRKLRFILSIALLPIIGKYQKKNSFVRILVTKSLKLTLKLSREIDLIHTAILQFSNLAQSIKSNQGIKRSQIALILREIGKKYYDSLLIAKIYSHSNQDLIQKFDLILSQIFDLDLIGVWDVSPLINGKEIMQILNLDKKNARSIIGTVIKSSLEWQLDNPKATKEDLINFIKQDFSNKN